MIRNSSPIAYKIIYVNMRDDLLKCDLFIPMGEGVAKKSGVINYRNYVNVHAK